MKNLKYKEGLTNKQKIGMYPLIALLSTCSLCSLLSSSSNALEGHNKEFEEAVFSEMQKSENPLDRAIYFTIGYLGTPGRELAYTIFGGGE